MCPSHYLTALNYRWLSWYNWNGCVSPGRSHANITLSSNDRLMHPNTKSGRREVQLNRSYTAAAGGELKEHSKDTTTEHQQHHSTKKSRTAEENHQHGTKGSQQHSTEGSRQHSAEGSPRRTQQHSTDGSRQHSAEGSPRRTQQHSTEESQHHSTKESCTADQHGTKGRQQHSTEGSTGTDTEGRWCRKARLVLGPWRPLKRLTRSEMSHMRSLRELQPEEWTAAKLSKTFGVSVSAVRRILRSKFDPSEEVGERQEKRAQEQRLKRRGKLLSDARSKKVENVNYKKSWKAV